ncbi:hypothetical protein Plhal304r1_c055g0141381 [Plasmopara halstedii]
MAARGYDSFVSRHVKGRDFLSTSREQTIQPGANRFLTYLLQHQQNEDKRNCGTKDHDQRPKQTTSRNER